MGNTLRALLGLPDDSPADDSPADDTGADDTGADDTGADDSGADDSAASAAAERYRADFAAAIARVNESLRTTAAFASSADHERASSQRDDVTASYQKVLRAIVASPQEPPEKDASRVLSAVAMLGNKATSLAARATAAHQQWTQREGALDEAAAKVIEVEGDGHPKASALRKVVDAIRNHAAARNFRDAAAALDTLVPKVEALYREITEGTDDGSADSATSALESSAAVAETTGHAVPKIEAMLSQYNLTAKELKAPPFGPQIIRQLSTLSPSELKLFADTHSLSGSLWSQTAGAPMLKSALDGFRANMKQRRAARQETVKAQFDLFGTDGLYEPLRQYLDADSEIKARPYYDEWEALVPKYGYKSPTEFINQINAYEETFEAEAGIVAQEMLDRSEVSLRQADEARKDAAVVEKLFNDLGSARETLGKASWWKGSSENEINLMRHSAVQKVLAIAKRDRDSVQPLLGRIGAIDESLALELAETDDLDDLSELLKETTEERLEAVADVREELEDDESFIWNLDVVVQNTLARTGADKSELYASIIEKKQEKELSKPSPKKLGIALLAIGAGVLSMGAGTLAVGAAAVGIGAAAWDAVEEYREYSAQDAAFESGLSLNDPSLAWVIISVATVPLEFLAAKEVLHGVRAARSAKAARVARIHATADMIAGNPKVEQAIQRFSKEYDEKSLALLGDELQRNTTLHPDVKKALWNQAVKEFEATRALDAMASTSKFAKSSPAASDVDELSTDFQKLLLVEYRQGRRPTPERFMEWKRTEKLLGGSFSKLTPEKMALAKQAYGQAKEKLDDVVLMIKGMELTDDQVGFAWKIWARSPNMSTDEFIDRLVEMRHWSGVSTEVGLDAVGTAKIPRGTKNTAEHAKEGGMDVSRGTQTHSTAPDVRDAFGVKGADFESAHIGPTAFLKKVAGYSRGKAKTILLAKRSHKEFDKYWLDWVRRQRGRGRTEAPAKEIYDMMHNAINNISALDDGTKAVMHDLLRIEFWQELGLDPNAMLELPRIGKKGPRPGPPRSGLAVGASTATKEVFKEDE